MYVSRIQRCCIIIVGALMDDGWPTDSSHVMTTLCYVCYGSIKIPWRDIYNAPLGAIAMMPQMHDTCHVLSKSPKELLYKPVSSMS